MREAEEEKRKRRRRRRREEEEKINVTPFVAVLVRFTADLASQ